MYKPNLKNSYEELKQDYTAKLQTCMADLEQSINSLNLEELPQKALDKINIFQFLNSDFTFSYQYKHRLFEEVEIKIPWQDIVLVWGTYIKKAKQNNQAKSFLQNSIGAMLGVNSSSVTEDLLEKVRATLLAHGIIEETQTNDYIQLSELGKQYLALPI